MTNKNNNTNPNFRNASIQPPYKISSLQSLKYTRALMRSGELSDSEYRECGSAIQDAIDDARD